MLILELLAIFLDSLMGPHDEPCPECSKCIGHEPTCTYRPNR